MEQTLQIINKHPLEAMIIIPVSSKMRLVGGVPCRMISRRYSVRKVSSVKGQGQQCLISQNFENIVRMRFHPPLLNSTVWDINRYMQINLGELLDRECIFFQQINLW